MHLWNIETTYHYIPESCQQHMRFL
jgi:hypothetical protein